MDNYIAQSNTDEDYEQDEDCAHYGIECEPDDCRCQCQDCRDAKLDLENEIGES